MTKTEKVLLGVALAVLIAIVAYAHKTEIIETGKDVFASNTSTKRGGPVYLTYNQVPYWGEPSLSMLPFTGFQSGASRPVNTTEEYETGALYENY